tara:strand:+ start:1032 stop:1151 length:120 start_codon:yes stop_codon:yes gene_type:complete
MKYVPEDIHKISCKIVGGMVEVSLKIKSVIKVIMNHKPI